MDLDGFQDGQRQCGHLIGDQLLLGVAKPVGEVFAVHGYGRASRGRLGETFTVARLGGDEFTVLLDDIQDPSDAKRAAERMMKALRRHSFWWQGGVHLREHRNCLEQLSLPATGRDPARCRHGNV